jgi:hypothetical protein
LTKINKHYKLHNQLILFSGTLFIMPHLIPPFQASAQGDRAPIAVSSKSPRLASHQKFAHLAHLREIKLDFHHFSDAQTCASCASGKNHPAKPFGHLAHLAAFSFLRSNSHVFEFSTSGHLIVHLATFPLIIQVSAAGVLNPGAGGWAIAQFEK